MSNLQMNYGYNLEMDIIEGIKILLTTGVFPPSWEQFDPNLEHVFDTLMPLAYGYIVDGSPRMHHSHSVA